MNDQVEAIDLNRHAPPPAGVNRRYQGKSRALSRLRQGYGAPGRAPLRQRAKFTLCKRRPRFFCENESLATRA